MNCVAATRGRYGNIIYWNRDAVIGSAIAAYGEWFESEVDVFRRHVRPGAAVIDCGANIGAHTIALASIVGPVGIVMAIEPQRPMFQVMCANAILNGYLNVHPVLAAAGSSCCHKTFVEPDYTLTDSFGGFETTRRAEAGVGAVTRICRIDALWETLFNRSVAFIKVDVEGMESEVVEGARYILERDRPVLYVENDRRDNSANLIRRLRGFGYDLFWHIARFYNPDNFTGRPDDIPLHRFGWIDGKLNGASLMLLCLPKEKHMPPPPDMRVVGSEDEYPPFDGEQE
jgi:FkbM family methyltransferase